MSGDEPVVNYSRRLDNVMKELGLSRRRINWDVEKPDGVTTELPIVLIHGMYNNKHVGAWATIAHIDWLRTEPFISDLKEALLLDIKAKE